QHPRLPQTLTSASGPPRTHVAWLRGSTRPGPPRYTAGVQPCRVRCDPGRGGRMAYTPRQRARLGPNGRTMARGKGRPAMLSCIPFLGRVVGGLGGGGWGVGRLLRGLVPAIDRGMATLCGLVATGVALLAFGQLLTLVEPAETEEESPPVWRVRP